jgi:AraC family transcriptional regulator, transcriptional activator of pobA
MKNIPIRHITAAPKGKDIALSFHIRTVRDVLKEKDMTQELHRHDFYYVLALKKGAGTHVIDFTSHKIVDDTVFFIRPGQVHQLTLKAGSTGYLMAFNNDFYHAQDEVSSQLLRKAASVNLYQVGTAGIKKVLSLLSYIWDEYTHQQEGYQEVIKANLSILFIELVRQNTQVTSGKPDSYAQQRLQDFTELLEKRIYTCKQVSQYADMLNLSPYQLNAITKESLGKTGSEVIKEYIILESKRYLLATSNQVNQIAYQLGYEDVSYFIRFFKRHTGFSPEAFRTNFK